MPERTREEFLELLRRSNPRTRKTVKRVIEGKVDQDGAAFVQEQLSFVEADMTVRQVDFISSRTCSFGHLVDQQTKLVGVCQVCNAYLCSTPGCASTCKRCGKALCPTHSHSYGEEVYCPGCRPWKWLRLFLGL